MTNINWDARRSGKTTWMLNELIKEVTLGQPYASVVGRDYEHALSMMPYVIEMFNIIDNSCEIKDNRIYWLGSEIQFVSKKDFDKKICGNRGSQYFDHYTIGE